MEQVYSPLADLADKIEKDAVVAAAKKNLGQTPISPFYLQNGNTKALTELTEMITKLYGYPAGFVSQTGFLGLQTFETVALTFGREKVQAILAKGAIHPSVYDPVKALKA